jgi:hypothetical protein
MNKKCIIKYELFARLIKFSAIMIIWLDSPSFFEWLSFKKKNNAVRLNNNKKGKKKIYLKSI